MAEQRVDNAGDDQCVNANVVDGLDIMVVLIPPLMVVCHSFIKG